MHIFRAQQIPCAVIALIAASFTFSCENRYVEGRAENTTQSGKKQNSQKRKNDAAFVALAANDLQLEFQLAQIALRRATSPEVKEFAISLMTDHSIAMDELREIASRIDAPLPDKLSPDERRDFAHIARRKGLQFDRAFCDFIYLNNTVSLKNFEQVTEDSHSEILGNWAWGKIHVLKKNIAMAQSIESSHRESAGLSVIGQ